MILTYLHVVVHKNTVWKIIPTSCFCALCRCLQADPCSLSASSKTVRTANPAAQFEECEGSDVRTGFWLIGPQGIVVPRGLSWLLGMIYWFRTFFAGGVSHIKYLISLLGFKEADTVNTEAVMMTAIDSVPPRLRLPVERQSVTPPTASPWEVSHHCVSPPSLWSEWADETQRKIAPLVLIRLCNYRVEMLFTETCAEVTVEERR